MQVDKSSHAIQVSEMRKRSEERANSQARRGRQELTRRQSRSPEHRSSGNKGRRSSQDARCGCWNCQHRMECSIATMEELREESGKRGIIV